MSQRRAAGQASGSTAVRWSTLGGDFNATEIGNATLTSPFTVGQTCSSNSSLQPILHVEWH